MKNIMNGSIKLCFLLGMLLMFSCTKEEINSNENLESLDLFEYKDLKDFPEELTIDNWRKFIWAPQGIIDKLNNNYSLKKATVNSLEDYASVKMDQVVGKVSCSTYYSFGGNNSQNLGGVEISIQSCSTISLSDEGMLNWFLEASEECTGDVCFDDEWDYRDGISTLDLLVLGRHIVGIEPFFSHHQFVAGDVTKDGAINTFDLLELQQLILFVIPKFLNHESIVFLSLVQLSDMQGEFNQTGTIDLLNLIETTQHYSPCLPNYLFDNVRTAIKIGDVNGSFCGE